MIDVHTYQKGKVFKGKLNDLKGRQTVWVDMENPTEKELDELSKYTDIESHQIRAWMEGKKKPTALDFKKYSVLTFLAPRDKDEKCEHFIFTEPCVILVSNNRNDFITIHKHSLKAVKEIGNYSKKHKEKIFKDRATHLLFTLLDEIIEHYYDSLDQINETVQSAEALSLNIKPGKNIMHEVLAVKKSIIYFHKSLIANREVIISIEQEHLGFLDSSLIREFRVLSSSITQLIEINSTYRDILNTATEIHLAVVSNNLNTTMKKVTSWAGIILIPSLIAGIFGMNFRHFSVFEWKYGVEFSLASMIISVALLYWYFKRRDWI